MKKYLQNNIVYYNKNLGRFDLDDAAVDKYIF